MISESELAEVIRIAVDGGVARVRTALPARITAFNAEGGPTASVQPSIQGAYWDVDLEEPVYYDFPVITNCPVHYPAGGGYQMTYPLEAGDDCLILIAERSIDEWMGTGNESNTPRMLRRFDLSDAIVIPGLAPAARPLTIDPDAFQIKNENGSVLRINEDGTAYLGNAAADLVAQTEALAERLEDVRLAAHVFATACTGATDPVVSAAATTLQGTLASVFAPLAAIIAAIGTISE